MDNRKGKHMRGSFMFKIEQNENGTFVASITQDSKKAETDDVGALYYVVVVIFIYGCSILMMIASYIRKNNTDRKLNRYLKEMANVRKREQQTQLFHAAARTAAHTRKSMCENEDQKWSGASHWSKYEEEFEDKDLFRTSRLKSAQSSSSNGDDSSRKQSESDGNFQQKPLQEDSSLNNPLRGQRPKVRIICETSDPESDVDAFFQDDPGGSPHLTISDLSEQIPQSKDQSVASQDDLSTDDDRGDPDDDDDDDPNDDDGESRNMLLDTDDDIDNQTEGSDIDLLGDKASSVSTSSGRLQWTDYQVVSSV